MGHPLAETHAANMESVVVFAPRAGEVEVICLTRNPRVTPEALAAAFSSPSAGGKRGS